MPYPYDQTPGIPTRYKGRQYRSRLEARWACFFDLLGWRYEYEPCDFEGWIPDFVLCEADTVFVEVKPVTTFPADVAAKIDATSCAHEALIVGMTLQRSWMAGSFEDENPVLGWLRQANEEQPPGFWAEALFGVWEPKAFAAPRIGFCHCEGSFHDRITGGYDGGCWGGISLDVDTLYGLWTQAGNETQWRSGFAPLSTHLSSRLSTML